MPRKAAGHAKPSKPGRHAIRRARKQIHGKKSKVPAAAAQKAARTEQEIPELLEIEELAFVDGAEATPTETGEGEAEEPEYIVFDM